MLKNSARNSRLLLSVSRVSFDREKSICLKLGPKTELRGQFPNVPVAGIANAAGLNQLVMDLFVAYGLTPGMQSGRWLVKLKLPYVFPGMYTVSAMPVCRMPREATFQPLTRAPATPPVSRNSACPRPKGRS